jgi:hypothetical protein
MTVDSIIRSVFDTEDFTQYEQDVYAKHQEIAEREIIAKLNEILSNALFLTLLKQWGAQSACRFLGYREITVRLKAGKRWQVLSPVFLRAKPKRKRGKAPKRQTERNQSVNAAKPRNDKKGHYAILALSCLGS